MGWIQSLYETYENNVHMAGVLAAGKATLVPESHMPANAQIEITLTETGEFNHVEKVPKEDRNIFIPVTEASSGRSSGVAPHPLCDTLPYVAGDYADYLEEGSKEHTLSVQKHQAYLEQLGQWANWEGAHPKVSAIYTYCCKNTVASDLIRCGILALDENGKLLPNKIEGNPPEKCLVRWKVFGGLGSNASAACWEDAALVENYIQFLQNAGKDLSQDICYATGEKSTIAVNHPKGIVASSYGAKLISANDESGFTYRGRFTEAEQANAVSYEVSQKAHNALKWLVANQGVAYGDRTFVCWNPKGKRVPHLDPEAFLEDEEDEENKVPNTMPIFQQRLEKALNGYWKELKENDDILILALDAATTGRLSITYFNELKALDFLKQLKNWQETCCWYYTVFDQEGKPYLEIKSPAIRRIIEYAFGTEQGAFVQVDSRVLREHSQRLLHCILDGQPAPRDMVHALAMRASMPLAYSRSNHEKILSTACAFLRKSQYDATKQNKEKKEKDDMTLDENNTNRSYLFGRLLAIEEAIERSTYNREETREPNAIRLQNAFQQHPMHTFKLLEDAMVPYKQRLTPQSRKYYADLIGTIIDKFQDEDTGILNNNLEDCYLLGYYLQRKALREKQNNKNNEENQEDA